MTGYSDESEITNLYHRYRAARYSHHEVKARVMERAAWRVSADQRQSMAYRNVLKAVHTGSAPVEEVSGKESASWFDALSGRLSRFRLPGKSWLWAGLAIPAFAVLVVAVSLNVARPVSPVDRILARSLDAARQGNSEFAVGAAYSREIQPRSMGFSGRAEDWQQAYVFGKFVWLLPRVIPTERAGLSRLMITASRDFLPADKQEIIASRLNELSETTPRDAVFKQWQFIADKLIKGEWLDDLKPASVSFVEFGFLRMEYEAGILTWGKGKNNGTLVDLSRQMDISLKSVKEGDMKQALLLIVHQLRQLEVENREHSTLPDKPGKKMRRLIDALDTLIEY